MFYFGKELFDFGLRLDRRDSMVLLFGFELEWLLLRIIFLNYEIHEFFIKIPPKPHSRIVHTRLYLFQYFKNIHIYWLEFYQKTVINNQTWTWKIIRGSNYRMRLKLFYGDNAMPLVGVSITASCSFSTFSAPKSIPNFHRCNNDHVQKA